MDNHRIRWTVGSLALACICWVAQPLSSQPPEIPKISSFAPAKDLIQQVDFYIGRISESLADPADFDLAKQSRTLKDANTLAALALMLAVHDEQHALKPGAAALLKLSQDLSNVGENAQRGMAALEAIKRARTATVGGGEPVKWEKAASLSALMKAVPLVHTGLKRGVEPNRLARQAAQTAGQSAALAAIAQASMLDPEPAESPAEVQQWVQMCIQMRDASGKVNSAVHAQDQAQVVAAMKLLSQSCDACHAKFRHE